jgi:hypothetical protein
MILYFDLIWQHSNFTALNLYFYWGNIFFAHHTCQCVYFEIESRKELIAWVEVEI